LGTTTRRIGTEKIHILPRAREPSCRDSFGETKSQEERGGRKNRNKLSERGKKKNTQKRVEKKRGSSSLFFSCSALGEKLPGKE
jgi:hypothetical protein